MRGLILSAVAFGGILAIIWTVIGAYMLSGGHEGITAIVVLVTWPPLAFGIGWAMDRIVT